jgi:hypothetical protein
MLVCLCSSSRALVCSCLCKQWCYCCPCRCRCRCHCCCCRYCYSCSGQVLGKYEALATACGQDPAGIRPQLLEANLLGTICTSVRYPKSAWSKVSGCVCEGLLLWQWQRPGGGRARLRALPSRLTRPRVVAPPSGRLRLGKRPKAPLKGTPPSDGHLAEAFMSAVCVLGACYDPATITLMSLGLNEHETRPEQVQFGFP